MKATDLMIGDWVYDTLSQTNKKVNRSHFEINPLNGVCYAENLYPISLTAEILERNGFKEYNGYGYASNKGYCLKEFYINNDFTIKTANIDCKINFVHELQHALRLCGIEKEIQL